MQVAVESLVHVLEATVVEAVLDEAGILPGAVEQDARQRELRYAHQVLREGAASDAVGGSIAGHGSRQAGDIDARLDLTGEGLKLQSQPPLVVGVELQVAQQPLMLGGGILGEQP